MNRMLSKLHLSISSRLTLWYGLSMLILLGLFVAYLYVSFHVSLHRDFNESLQEERARLLASFQENPDAFSSKPLSQFAGADTYVRLLSLDGHVLRRSANFGSWPPLAPNVPDETQETVTSRTWGGVRAQSLYVPLQDIGNGQGGWLEVTRLESGMHHELHQLAWLLGLGTLFGVGLAIGAGYGLARRALRPVSDLTRAARDIQREGLGRRLPVSSGVRDELTELAEAFNGMLSQIEASFDRERRFRADAAHELMTPLSAVQSETDVTLRKQRSPEEYQQSMRAIQSRARHMSGLVERLLTLSRLEADGQVSKERVNLSQLTRRMVEEVTPQAEAQEIELKADIPSGVFVGAAVEDTTAILENLLGNALKYTPRGEQVNVLLESAKEEVVLRISDTGLGFEEESDELFERFHRGASEDVQEKTGAGLGLSIVRAVTEAYGGSITAYSPGKGQGSTFVVRLPSSE